MTIQMKVRYFLTDHYSSKCVVAKEMSMRRIDLDRKITIPSAKLGNNRCTSSGGEAVVPLPHYADLGVRFYNQ